MASNIINNDGIIRKSSNSVIFRQAISLKGTAGSLYNACQDQIIYEPYKENNYTKTPNNLISCNMIEWQQNENLNLLEIIEIDQEMRLSIILGFTPADGVGAIINYVQPIDRFTRILHYCQHTTSDCVSEDTINSLLQNPSSLIANQATHIIECVNWGIDAYIVFQLPPDGKIAGNIDYLFIKLCTILKGDKPNVKLDEYDEQLFEKIVFTEVFSNISALCEVKSIVDFSRKIDSMKDRTHLYQAFKYHLKPIQELLDTNYRKQFTFHQLEKRQANRIETYLLRLFHDRKRLSSKIGLNYPNVQRHLKKVLSNIQEKWKIFETTYSDQISSFRKSIITIREGNREESSIDQLLNGTNTEKLSNLIKQLTEQLTELDKKENLIKDLSEKKFEYKNAIDYTVEPGDNEETIKDKLQFYKGNIRIVCFSDTLYQKNKPKWYTLQDKFVEERNMNSQIHIVYIDFSYFDKILDQIMVYPSSSEINIEQVQSAATNSPPKLSMNEDIVNILLLGESGAGKSTFINAFVNYLNFRELEDAEKKPIVLIPVSFIMTSGNNFTEHHVTFGGLDTLANEDFTNSGQSVTQHCKSYIFSYTNDDKTKRRLRIIDTPGIGDVRGSAQDDINMQHILSFISNLTHLNAVCILMKPNNARLNTFLRSCLIQLFDLLGEDARERIIFCFTNARSTFYTPGDSGPLLKQLLSSFPVKNVPFTKQNTFCFDSESFRYLVAIQNNVPIDNLNGKEYKESWNRSADESKRFVKYILSTMASSLIMGQHQSIKDAQLRIGLMVRPILEAIRNTLRNIVLHNSELQSLSIELKPRIIKCTSAICSKCPSKALQINRFWIIPDSLHVFHNKCRTCACSPDDHFPIDYQLEYQECKQSSNISENDMKNVVKDLTETCAEFIYFLQKASKLVYNDFFLEGFTKMIKQEEDICQHQQSNDLNTKLIEYLKIQKEVYEKMKKTALENQETIDLETIYRKIEKIIQFPIIKSQINVVTEWHNFMVQYYEHNVKLT